MKVSVTLLGILLSINLIAQDGNYVKTNRVKIYYETHGEGEPLLLLHGFSLSHKSWELWIDDLSKDHLLIIPDLRGHGYSTNPSNVYTAKLTAQDMYGLMDHLEIDRFHAIGHSAGAVALIHMATMDTARVSSMILIGGAPTLPQNAREVFKQITYETWRSHMEAHHPRGEEQIRILIKQVQGFADSYDDINFTAPYLSRIKCPTLIIHGDRDVFFSVDNPLALYKGIPNSYLWVVPNDGHSPIGIYNRNSIWSDVLLTVMENFFSGKWK